jgi:hypothetical protein
MKKRLIVVGNAEPRQDRSEFIDRCDVTIRFNLTPFFGIHKTGIRTTILCLFGLPYPDGGEVPRLNRDIARSCHTIWVETPAFVDPLVRGYDVPRQRITLLDLHGVYDNHAIEGAEQIERPSSGFQVLRYLVNSPALFGEYRIFIYGFEWRGGARHTWELERRQAARYLELELLEYVLE